VGFQIYSIESNYIDLNNNANPRLVAEQSTEEMINTKRSDFHFGGVQQLDPTESFSTQRDGGKPKEGNRESSQIGRER
jgi:hypothetical protein